MKVLTLTLKKQAPIGEENLKPEMFDKYKKYISDDKAMAVYSGNLNKEFGITHLVCTGRIVRTLELYCTKHNIPFSIEGDPLKGNPILEYLRRSM